MNTLLAFIALLQIQFNEPYLYGNHHHFKDTTCKTLTITEISETENAYIIFAQDSILWTIVSLKTQSHGTGEPIKLGKSYELWALTYFKKNKQFMARSELKIEIHIRNESLYVPLYGANILLPLNLNGLEYSSIDLHNCSNNNQPPK